LAQGLELCQRRVAARCRRVNRFIEPQEAGWCSWNPQGPPPGLSLFPNTNPGELGMVSRSLRLGRLLWCLASSPWSRAAVELFAGTGGGSTTLLAHGLATHGGALYSFEREKSLVVHAQNVLRSWELDANVVSTNDASSVSGMGPGAWLLWGEPLPLAEVATGGPIRALCTSAAAASSIGGVDMVVLDPHESELYAEWEVIERVCNPRFVVVHNSNLPKHAGWVRHHLLQLRSREEDQDDTSSSWHELLNGSHPSIWDDAPGKREWSLLWRHSPGWFDEWHPPPVPPL